MLSRNAVHDKNKIQPVVVPETGIIQSGDANKATWEVWYKGVRFAELEELKDAHDRLQKLLELDTTK